MVQHRSPAPTHSAAVDEMVGDQLTVELDGIKYTFSTEETQSLRSMFQQQFNEVVKDRDELRKSIKDLIDESKRGEAREREALNREQEALSRFVLLFQ